MEMTEAGYLVDCKCRKTEKIQEALIAALEKISPPVASATNPHFKSKYVPLSEWYKYKKILKEYDIYIKHASRIDPKTGKTVARTWLLHKSSGEVLEDERYFIEDRGTAQSHGSDDTYFKRYALRSLLCLDANEDDDDGEEARAYHERVKKLSLYVNGHPKKTTLLEEICAHFKVNTLYNLGNGGVFDAWIFTMKYKG